MNEVDTKLANETIPLAFPDLGTVPVLGVTFLAIIFLFGLIWWIHVKIEDAGIVDFIWAGGFAVAAWLAVGLSGPPAEIALLVAGLVTVWAVRLTVHMVWRHRLMGGEDARYAAMRQRGGPGFWWQSLYKVFLLQAVIQFILCLPILAVAMVGGGSASTLLVGLGLLLFVAGFLIETIADFQLWTFKARPENRGRLFTEGLFAWSRHPNYFGETVLWWGIALIAYAGSGAVWLFASPLLLTALLLKVSGVALLDTHLAETKPGYADWARRTSAFIPLPPRDPRDARQSS